MKKLIVILGLVVMLTATATAITNIDVFDRWAWNDAIGWIDLRVTANTQNEVIVTGSEIKGSGVIKTTGDFVSFNCATSPALEPNQDICTDTFSNNYFVSNDGFGNLGGWAWSDSIGWISFCGNATENSTWNGSTWLCPLTTTYQVRIIDAGDFSRDFTGYAWADSVGWINFNNCSSGCGSISYKVKTYWGAPGSPSTGDLLSRTFDTCPNGDSFCIDGVAYNYIIWRGSLNGVSNSVKFQLATSSCENGGADAVECADTGTSYWGLARTSGDGAFVGLNGFSSTYYGPVGPDTPMPIAVINHNNKRYFRYRVFLDKSAATTESPVVTDIVVNYSF